MWGDKMKEYTATFTMQTPEKLREEMSSVLSQYGWQRARRRVESAYDCMWTEEEDDKFHEELDEKALDKLESLIRSHTNSVLEKLLEEMPERKQIYAGIENHELNHRNGYNQSLSKCKSILRGRINND